MKFEPFQCQWFPLLHNLLLRKGNWDLPIFKPHRGVFEAGVWCSVEHWNIHCKQQKGRVLERMIINDANTNSNLLAL